MSRYYAIVAIVFTAIAGAPSLAFAHDVGIECKLRGDKVVVEAYYDEGTAAAKAKVKVVNAKDEIVANGMTDSDGKWTFAAPSPGSYVVHLDAGAGHRAKTTLTIPSLTSVDAPSADVISDGPTRAEFTRTPWLKIGIGLALIAGLTAAILLATMMKSKKTGDRPA